MGPALGVAYDRRGQSAGSRAVVRYAEDFVVFCESQEDATRVKDQLDEERNDPNVFGDKHTGRSLLRLSWFKIVRHRLVRGTASPDDPSFSPGAGVYPRQAQPHGGPRRPRPPRVATLAADAGFPR